MRAFMTLPERIEVIARLCVPYGFMLFVLLVNISAVPHPLSLITQAPFVLMLVYYWSIYRPAMLPVWLVFIAGLTIDIFSSAPLGLNAILLIAAAMFLRFQQRFLLAQGFWILWLGFGIVLTADLLIHWLVMSGIYLHLLPLSTLLPLFILGILFFPVIYALLHLTHKLIAGVA